MTAADLLAEVENLALRLYYMETAKDDVRSDIAVMKRAAEKAEMEVAKSEMDKQKQVHSTQFTRNLIIASWIRVTAHKIELQKNSH